MAQWVRVGSVLCRCEAAFGQPSARQVVLDEVRQSLDSLRGQGLQLVVLSEALEAVGQPLPEHAESYERPGPILNAYLDFAAAERCVVAGSLKLSDGGRLFNAIVYVGPDGVLGDYRKTFLTIGELNEGLTPGSGPTLVQTPAGQLGGVICFDLNFEPLLQRYAPLKPDILVFSSMFHGGLMQATWAYRCRSYFVSALPFHGGGVLNPLGQTLATTDCYNPVATAAINLDRAVVHLDGNRAKFPEIRRRFGGQVEIVVPANLGPALITSLSDDLRAADIVREFELELLDDYLARAARANEQARGPLT